MPAANRVLTLLAIAVTLASVASNGVAQTRAFDAKALARYDLSYAKCEARFPAMQGHRDEAYLSLWRIKTDDKSSARLASVRGGVVYRGERRIAQQAAGTSSTPAASSPLERECQGLWGEYQRVAKDKK